MLTYDEIINIEFQKSPFGGYKADSVDDFVNDVAETVKELTEENLQLVAKIEEMNNSLKEYKNSESTLHAALVIAQEASQKLIAESKDKAEATLTDAAEKAQKTVEEAKSNAEEVISKAQSDSAELLSKTKERASEILREALTKASGITKKAKENCYAEEQKYETLKSSVDEFRKKILLLYKSHIESFNDIKTDENIEDDATSVVEENTAEPMVEEYKTGAEDTVKEYVEEPVAVEETFDSSEETDDAVEEIDLSKINFSDFSDADDNKQLDFEISD